jgi:hypothetical protein
VAKKRTDKRFGKWTVIQRTTEKKSYSLCRCDCGVEKLIYRSNLTSGKSTMCRSCKDSMRPANWAGGDIIPMRYWQNLKRSNERRKNPFDFNISIEDAERLFISQDGKCSITKLPLSFGRIGSNDMTASLDRINNSLGYFIDNVQWVHKVINRMKGSMEDELFIKFCKEVVNGQKENGKEPLSVQIFP